MCSKNHSWFSSNGINRAFKTRKGLSSVNLFFLFITVIFQKITYIFVSDRCMSTKGFRQKLHVFERFHFGLGGSKEPPEPPVDPPQDQRVHFQVVDILMFYWSNLFKYFFMHTSFFDEPAMLTDMIETWSSTSFFLVSMSTGMLYIMYISRQMQEHSNDNHLGVT